MKTKIFLLFAVLSFFGFTFLNGYAKSAKLKEPTGPESTLLMGRIQLIGSNFPRNSAVNGVHTKGITIDLKDETNNFIYVTSRGDDGLFYVADPRFTHYRIVGLSIQLHESNVTWDIRYPTNDALTIQQNSVNNLGDILWRIDYGLSDTTEYKSRGPSQTRFSARIMIEYKMNYDEVKIWFEETYPKSVWINKDWNEIQIRGEQ
jgi:hypothetical protein